MEQFFRRKSIFEIIKEADEDEQGTNTSSTNTPTTDSGSEEPTADTGDVEVPEDDTSGDEDFNIDTSIDDEGAEEDPMEGDGNDSGSQDSSTDFGGGSTSGTDPEEEPIEANTDIFASLSAEEQIIKIKELKGCYNDLYTSIQDLITKIDEIDLDEYNKDIITRVSSIMLKTKVRLMDYILNVFGTKSYIENDVMFNRFLAIVNSVSGVVEELIKQNASKLA